MAEKHQGTIAVLRGKSRETNKAAKAANKRIAELEAENAELQQRVAGLMAVEPEKDKPASARRAAPVAAKAAPAKVAKAKPGRKPSRKGVDPGDGVPPGVAVEEADPLDEEAEAVKHALEENLTVE